MYLLIIFLLGVHFNAQAQCLKTIAWNNEIPQQTNSTDVLQISRDLKLLKMALTELDCQINFVKMPWARSIVELKNGRVDILDGAYKTTKRQRFAWYSDFKSHSYTTLFMRKKDIGKYTLINLQDIYKYKLRIGTQIGTLYGHEFGQFMADKKHALLNHPNISRKALWNMLKIGRIDGFISEVVRGLIELKSIDLTEYIGPTDFVVSNQANHFIFSKKSVSLDFVKAVDGEILKLNASAIIEPLKQIDE